MLGIADISPVTTEQIARTQQEMLDRRGVVMESIRVRRDGTPVPVELAITQIGLADGPAFLGVARDLTERRRAEDERRRLEGELAHAARMESLGRLAGGAAHDFNNLLTTILGIAELCQEGLDADGPRRDSHAVLPARGHDAVGVRAVRRDTLHPPGVLRVPGAQRHRVKAFRAHHLVEVAAGVVPRCRSISASPTPSVENATSQAPRFSRTPRAIVIGQYSAATPAMPTRSG
jgi:signal transduction histidine kinase